MATTPDDIYKGEILSMIRAHNNSPTLQINFVTGALSQHVATDKQSRILMISAANAAAMKLGFYLNDTGVSTIYNEVNRNTPYSSVLVTFRKAITQGATAIQP